MRKFVSACAAVALVLIAGCSNAQYQAAPSAGSQSNAVPSVTEPDAASVLYVAAGSLTQPGFSWAYAVPGRKPFCTISVPDGRITGIGVDSSGTLWVPQQGYISGVYDTVSYGPNCGSQGATLSSPPGYMPLNIVFGSDGTRYEVMSRVAPPNKGENYAFVAEYAPGATSPSGQLTDAHLTSTAGGPGLDAEGNVYVSCCTLENRKHPHLASVIKFKAAGSTTHGTLIPLAGMGYTPSVSVLFDRSNNMVLMDDDHATIEVYTPPYTDTPTTHAFYEPHPDVGQCAFDQAEKTLACANFDTGDVVVYWYPSFKYRYTIKPGLYPTGGVAFFPAP